MTDEKYLFVTDVADKKRTARGSHNKRTHCGRGGRVRLPSDNLTRKELNKMNGDVKSYRMNDPMTWTEFKTMPDDLKITYIKLLRERFGVSDSKIAKMMCAAQTTLSKEINRLNIGLGRFCKQGSFDKAGWEAWLNHNKIPENPFEGIIEEDQPPVEEVTICHTEPVIAEEVQTVQPEYITPVLTMTLNDKETIVRMLGYIEGLATGVINERLRLWTREAKHEKRQTHNKLVSLV